MSSLKERMAAMEKRLATPGVKLVMPDGREVKIDADPLLLLRRAIREKASGGELSETTRLISESVVSSEEGSSCLIELARSLLNSPTEEPMPALEIDGAETGKETLQ